MSTVTKMVIESVPPVFGQGCVPTSPIRRTPNPRVQHSSGETMRGFMLLVGPDKSQQAVQVVVYRTSSEHFAVVYPQGEVCRSQGFLNLKCMRVERIPNHDTGFIVREKGFDRFSCTFIVEFPEELDAWVSAFTFRSSITLRLTSLPIVEEEEL